MSQPPGYGNGDKDTVCKLLKSIYGTKQAPHDWNEDLNHTLTVAISKNDVHHDRTKHINIRYHFIREKIVNKEVEVQWVATGDQLADVLTKPVGKNVLIKMRERIMGRQQKKTQRHSDDTIEGEC